MITTKAIPKNTEMKTNTAKFLPIAEKFFTACDAHDVDGMLALCADGAIGRYAPYGRESLVPIRGGIDLIWRAFPNASDRDDPRRREHSRDPSRDERAHTR